MSESPIWLLIFGVLVIGCSTLWHWIIRAQLTASFLAACCAVWTFEFLGYLYYGHPSPIKGIALLIYGIIAMGAAMWVGIIVRWFRHRPSNANDAT